MFPTCCPPSSCMLTLQCSQRFLIELSTFIPRTCCRTTPTGIAFGRTAPAPTKLHTLDAAGDIAEDSARVWIVGRCERVSVRRLVVRPDSELLARRQRARHAWLAIFRSVATGGWRRQELLVDALVLWWLLWVARGAVDDHGRWMEFTLPSTVEGITSSFPRVRVAHCLAVLTFRYGQGVAIESCLPFFF